MNQTSCLFLRCSKASLLFVFVSVEKDPSAAAVVLRWTYGSQVQMFGHLKFRVRNWRTMSEVAGFGK